MASHQLRGNISKSLIKKKIVYSYKNYMKMDHMAKYKS